MLVVLLILAASAVARAQPTISELLASSADEGPDWVELQGRARSATDLSGWCLSDSASVGCPWRFPGGTTIGPGELLVVELSVDTTGFALSRKGDAVTLSDRDERVVVSVAFGLQRRGVSYGLSDASLPSWLYFCNPTPGHPNGAGGLTARPDTSWPFALSVSPPRGVFDDTAANGGVATPAALSITAVRCGGEPTGGIDAASLQIRYTLDESDPAAAPAPGGRDGNGAEEFSSPLPLTRTTIVRAVAVGAGGEPLTAVTTHTIIFASSVLSQSGHPTGWPQQWGGAGTTMSATPADYAVDPRAGLTAEALLSVPVVSLVMDSIDGWFGAAGLYNNRASTTPYQTSFEFIPPPLPPVATVASTEQRQPAGPQMVAPQLHSGCGVSSQGGSSVNSSPRGWKDEKASLRLRFKSVSQKATPAMETKVPLSISD